MSGWQSPTTGCGIRNRNSTCLSGELLGCRHVEGGDRRPEEVCWVPRTPWNRCSAYKQFSSRGPLSDLKATLLILPLATV